MIIVILLNLFSGLTNLLLFWYMVELGLTIDSVSPWLLFVIGVANFIAIYIIIRDIRRNRFNIYVDDTYNPGKRTGTWVN